MSFEDDMIESGFWDGNDYMDYLMDEADRIQEKQREQEAQWEMFENYKSTPLGNEESSHYEIEDVDELFFEGYDKEEELEKQSRTIERIKKSWIVKLWIDENPQKAQLWKTYFKGISAIRLDVYIEKPWLYIYEEWKKWLEEYEEFEEFKTKSVKEWESLKNLTLTKYLICALTGEHYLESLNDCDSNTNVYKKYKIFKLWLKDNEDLWNNYIIYKYTPSTDLDKISCLTAWRDTFKFYDPFAVWKFKHPSLWRIKSKEWFHNNNLMFEWIRINHDIWQQWNIDHSQLREMIYSKYKLKFDKTIDFDDEDELIDFILMENDRCTEHTDLDLLRLWIKKHVKEWKDWKYLYLWEKEYNTLGWMNSLNTNDYFETWCKLYPKKYENWLNNGYKQWLKCKKDLEIWFLWLYDGNSYAFYEWAKINIADWNKIMGKVMNFDLHSAHCDTYGTYGYGWDVNHWMQCHSNIWDNQQNDVLNTLLRKKWKFNDDFKKTYIPTYKIDIKIKELKYLSQIGFKIFHEGFAIIEMENKYGFFNEKGEIITPIIYDKVLNYRNGFAPVCIIKNEICKDFGRKYAIEKELWGIVDKKGKVVAQPIYDKILQITEKYIVFIKDFVCGVAELATGNEFLYPQYDNIKILDNGMWVACNKGNNENNWALISDLGNIMSLKYSYIFNSNNDIAMVVKNAILSNNNNGYLYGEWGFIDMSGSEVEPLIEFDSPLSFEKYWIDNHKII